MTILDRIHDWEELRASYERQIEFFAQGPGLNPPLPIATLRDRITELERVINRLTR